DSDLGVEAKERVAALDGEIAALKETLAGLETEWAEEQKIVGEIRSLRDILNPKEAKEAKDAKAKTGEATASAPAPAPSAAAPALSADDARRQIREKFDALEARAPEKRMIYAHVDEQAVASVVSDWTGIPVGRMVKDEVETVLNLA